LDSSCQLLLGVGLGCYCFSRTCIWNWSTTQHELRSTSPRATTTKEVRASAAALSRD